MGEAVTEIRNVRVFDSFRLTDRDRVMFSGGRFVEEASADRSIDGEGRRAHSQTIRRRL